MRWIALAPMLVVWSGCSAAETPRATRPDRPKLEKVHLRVSGQERDAAGRIVFQSWVIHTPDCEKFQKNMERMWAYVYALEQAPFWEGDPPPRID